MEDILLIVTILLLVLGQIRGNNYPSIIEELRFEMVFSLGLIA